MALFLGLDLSTQSLKSTVTNADGQIVSEQSVNFHRDLPKYGTHHGGIAGPDGEITTPVALWLESLDIVLQGLASAGVDFSAIVAVAGAAQQHGSVYWSKEGPSSLKTLDPARTLHEQLVPAAFSLPNAPIWQDSSTTAECRILEEAIGGAQALADLTGSRAYERFTASQILKIRTKKPEAYAVTENISLISSFLASLFLCQIAPIECSDASGMNLMSIATQKWDDRLLLATGGEELRSKLAGEPVPGGTTLGTVGKWWVERYGFSPECIVAPFTGDNPSTIVTLSNPGDAILSLGTSTTLLVSIPPPSETVPPPTCSTASHILAHPTAPGGSIYMLCYKNGALTRELVRDTYSQHSWATFNEQVEATPPGNNGLLGFYFTLKEIIPDGVQGDHFFKNGERVFPDVFPVEAHARAVLESQLLSIRARLIDTIHTTSQASVAVGDDASTLAATAGLKRVIMTGGSADNHVIQQIVADILGLPVFVASSSGSAATGGALLAKYAWWKRGLAPEAQTNASFEEMRKEFGELAVDRVAEPSMKNEHLYGRILDEFRQCEKVIVDGTRRADGPWSP